MYMPKKKQVVVDAPPAPTVQEPPVVFFLKVNPDVLHGESSNDTPIPSIDPSMTYSEILEKEHQQQQQRFDEKIVHDLLSKLHTQATYPSNAACFWCCHGFHWKPFVLPIHYDAYNELYAAEGHFCSPECALAHLYESTHNTDSQRWLRHTLLRTLYAPLYSNQREILPAPDRRLLRMFGGPLDIEQYRSYLATSETPIITALPPVRLYIPAMNTHIPNRDVKKYVTLSTETVDKASQQLRLKRSKPVHASVPTLDQCLLKANERE
jgi:hypothetical protein